MFQKFIRPYLDLYLINAFQFTINPTFFYKVQYQEIYPFIFLPDNTLSNITNLMDNNKTAQFTIVNSMSDDDDDQEMQLFKEH
uniref:Uncharacterized protein n=1 Tax=Rhizophagus irregularis (strain DAOM 181602 / DAOM 197198 / MUCL 43194) TaxID=747089 RepID=U9T0A1_RHIID